MSAIISLISYAVLIKFLDPLFYAMHKISILLISTPLNKYQIDICQTDIYSIVIILSLYPPY